MPSPWRKACKACTQSKRQCTKQVPSCRRCTDRGVDCVYPSPRRKPVETCPATAATCGWSLDPLPSDDFVFDCPLTSATPDSLLDTGIFNTQPVPAAAADPPQSLVLRDSWFLTPRSWERAHSSPQNPEAIEESKLHEYISTVKTWLREWTTEGQNPLVHPQLYQGHMPRCIQDAYTAVAAYVNKTPQTEDTVLHIIDQRAEQLLQDQTLQERLGFSALNTSDHLARVHALLVYQTLRLFDGSIRARVQADESLPTLFLWCEQMWQSAAAMRDWSLVALATVSKIGDREETYASWQAWILAESVRRAFLTANIVQHVYLTLKRSWSDCPGGVLVTLRAGLWEAKSAYAWSKGIRDQGPIFMQSTSADRVFVEALPGDVDDFGHAILSISYGSETIERWFGEKDRTASTLSTFPNASMLVNERS